MGRLIEADKIYNAVEQRYRVSSGIEHRCERDLLDLISDAETVDAVCVIRCEDCKFCRQNSYTKDYVCYARQNANIVRLTDFCSYGERKKE